MAHTFETTTTWSGATTDYRSYSRAHETVADGRPPIPSASDPRFRGEPDRWNPELLLVASLSQCHLLWMLHLAATYGVVITHYEDTAVGTMAVTEGGGGHFTEVLLRPVVTVEDASMVERAEGLHEKAHGLCFIASSMNFPVRHEPETLVAGDGAA